MYLIVGLGNPGPKYQNNRHNIGFHVVDRLAREMNGSWKDKFSGLYTKCFTHSHQDVVLLKPMTFMNLSGESVQKAMRFFKVPLDKVLVVHDELDIDFGSLKLKEGGGIAGHNGLRSIVKCCGGKDFARLRFGIGRPPGRGEVSSFVLSDFSKQERGELDLLIGEAADRATKVVQDGMLAAMNRYN